MKTIKTKTIKNKSLIQIAGFMAVAARTSPKAKGTDNIETLIINTEKEKKKLLNHMIKVAKKENKPGFMRDTNNCINSPAILLIGTKIGSADFANIKTARH